ncbi:Crp/Fnr family transcriptional regulator [Oxalobacteraceae bacterium A2-2]
MKQALALSTWPVSGPCRECRARPFCISPDGGLESGLESGLGAALGRQLRIARHETLYREGQGSASCYAVRHGSFKLTACSPSGEERIAGFAFNGDLLGLDGLGGRPLQYNAAAMEDSVVCELSWAALLAEPALAAHVRARLRRAIRTEQDTAQLLRHTRSDQRLAAYLAHLSQHYLARGYAADAFRLPMRRQDMADYLNLTPECTSRALHQLRSLGVLGADGGGIRILDLAGLQHIASGEPMRSAA